MHCKMYYHQNNKNKGGPVMDKNPLLVVKPENITIKIRILPCPSATGRPEQIEQKTGPGHDYQ